MTSLTASASPQLFAGTSGVLVGSIPQKSRARLFQHPEPKEPSSPRDALMGKVQELQAQQKFLGLKPAITPSQARDAAAVPRMQRSGLHPTRRQPMALRPMRLAMVARQSNSASITAKQADLFSGRSCSDVCKSKERNGNTSAAAGSYKPGRSGSARMEVSRSRTRAANGRLQAFTEENFRMAAGGLIYVTKEPDRGKLDASSVS